MQKRISGFHTNAKILGWRVNSESVYVSKYH